MEGCFYFLKRCQCWSKFRSERAGSITHARLIGSDPKLHIVKADTLFLLCLADLDRLKVYSNNVENVLVSENKQAFSVIRRFGHPFLLWAGPLQAYIMQSFNINPCYLTEGELRQLHRRFGHPSPKKLQSVLENSGHEVSKAMLEKLTKFCTFCQKHSKSPGRFKFTIYVLQALADIGGLNAPWLYQQK